MKASRMTILTLLSSHPVILCYYFPLAKSNQNLDQRAREPTECPFIWTVPPIEQSKTGPCLGVTHISQIHKKVKERMGKSVFDGQSGFGG